MVKQIGKCRITKVETPGQNAERRHDELMAICSETSATHGFSPYGDFGARVQMAGDLMSGMIRRGYVP